MSRQLADDPAGHLDLDELRRLDDHTCVREPLAAFHAVTRQLDALQDNLFQIDKDLSLAVGRARDAMSLLSAETHTAVDAMGVNPDVAQLRSQKRALEQDIGNLRPVLAEKEYRLSVARSAARQAISRQIRQEQAPALAELVAHLEGMKGPNSRISELERHKSRLLTQPSDQGLWMSGLDTHVMRLTSRLATITEDEEVSAPVAVNEEIQG